MLRHKFYNESLSVSYPANKKRKPIYQALIPGSLIFLSNEKDGRELYRGGLGFAKEMGYGTVMPLYVKK